MVQTRSTWGDDERKEIYGYVEGRKSHKTKAACFYELAEIYGTTYASISSVYNRERRRQPARPIMPQTRPTTIPVIGMKREREVAPSVGFVPEVFMSQLRSLLDTYYSVKSADLRKLEAEVAELNELVEAWVSQSLLQRVTQQTDFGRRLKVQVDKVGNVTKVIREGEEK